MKGQMRILNAQGDEKVEWDTEVQETVETAASRFAELLLTGSIPIIPSHGGNAAKRLQEFDPNAERIVMIPPMQGG